jgi:predicted permease
MLTESLLLAFVGGALGIAFAYWASEALLTMVSTHSQPVTLNVAPDGCVLAFTFLVSLVTAMLFGTAPALRGTQIDLTPALKEGRGRALEGGRSPLARTLIVSQVALSLVLLIAAGLFLHTLVNLADVTTGFNRQNVLLFSIDPASVGYKEDSRLASLYQRLEQRVSAEPGIRAASISFFTFNQGAWENRVEVEGNKPASGERRGVIHNVVGPSYFTTMGIPLLVGRLFEPQDMANSPKVAVINQTMAKEVFSGGSPIGRRFTIDDGNPAHRNIEVIGVVKDAKYISLREKQYPAAYYPYAQNIQYYDDFEVRYSGDSGTVISEVRRAVHQVDHTLPVSYRDTLTQQVDRSIGSQTLVARLSAFFGLLAVFLACIGIYGVMSYAVTRRTNEIGIRMALGAQRFEVVWLILRESLILTGLGVAVGLAAALAADRLASAMLFGLKSTDPLTMTGAVLILAVFSTLAGYIPARRASRLDPNVALRYE